MSTDELKEMLERAASNGDDITFEDFYFIMTKKTFDLLNTIKTNITTLLISLILIFYLRICIKLINI